MIRQAFNQYLQYWCHFLEQLPSFLGAITIFRSDKLSSVAGIIILALFVATLIIVILGYFVSYSDRIGQLYGNDLSGIRTSLKYFVEVSTLYILALLGIKYSPVSPPVGPTSETTSREELTTEKESPARDPAP